jgi:hypothetical protein
MQPTRPFGRATPPAPASRGPIRVTVSDKDPAASEAIFARILKLADKNGITNIGDVWSLVGALGGFASQQAVWKACIEPGNRNPGEFLVGAGTTSGELLYYGEAINQFLFCVDGTHHSFYSLVAGSIPDPTPDRLPNLRNISAYVASTVGTPNFGLSRLPELRGRFEHPKQALNRNWEWVQEELLRFRNPPAHWPMILGFAAARALKGADGDQPLGAILVMEAAIAMSKVNPATVPGATSGMSPPQQWSDRAVTQAREAELLAEVLPLLPLRVPF